MTRKGRDESGAPDLIDVDAINHALRNELGDEDRKIIDMVIRGVDVTEAFSPPPGSPQLVQSWAWHRAAQWTSPRDATSPKSPTETERPDRYSLKIRGY